MIDTSWLVWSRVLLDYANAAIASKIVYAVIGLVYAAVAYLASASIAAAVINSSGVTDWIELSFLLQPIFGALMSVIAHGVVSNRSIKLGMHVCYGLVAGTLFVIGGYTVLISLMNL
jgi:hypothetical protein